MNPGEYLLDESQGPVIANQGRKTQRVLVRNTGDRPIQVGSHYHFFETNRALAFDRAGAYGLRLNIPAGTAVRFEPGEEKEVELVEFGGRRTIHGFHGLLHHLTDGDLGDPESRQRALERARREGFQFSEVKNR
jgi:urease subunit beta/urease subunit gamma/beta